MISDKLKQSLFVSSSIVSLTVGIFTLVSEASVLVATIAFAVLITSVVLYFRSREPYEFMTLEHYLTLDIRDPSGKEVVASKQVTVRALKDNLFYYVEDMSSDGQLDLFSVSPGTVESVKREEGKVLVRTTLGRYLATGDTITRTFRCHYLNAFCNDREYYVQRQIYPSEHFNITILFPKDRPYKEYRAVRKVGPYDKPCAQPEERIIDGRPSLLWHIDKPLLKDNYRIDWIW